MSSKQRGVACTSLELDTMLFVRKCKDLLGMNMRSKCSLHLRTERHEKPPSWSGHNTHHHNHHHDDHHTTTTTTTDELRHLSSLSLVAVAVSTGPAPARSVGPAPTRGRGATGPRGRGAKWGRGRVRWVEMPLCEQPRQCKDLLGMNMRSKYSLHLRTEKPRDQSGNVKTFWART